MGYKASNNADTTLSESITQASTAIAVATGRGDDFPALGATDWTLITITDKNGAREIIKIIARTGDTMTVGTTPGGEADVGGRAQEGTAALSITYTDDHSVRCGPTAGLIEAMADYSDQGDLTATPAEIEAVCKGNTATAAELSQLHESGVMKADLEKLHSAYLSRNLEFGFAPVGSIVAYVPGYFTNGSNVGFTHQMVSANTIAAVNTLLNSSGWYVCNGAALNDADSGIFNGVGRYLPNLTDDRFLMGDTVAGGIGGANSNDISHVHSTGNFTLTTSHIPSHSHTVTVNSGGAHTHTVPSYDFDGPNDPRLRAHITHTGYSAWSSITTGSGGSHSHTASAGNTGSGNAHNHGNTGSSGSTSLENRPKYLSCFYIMRVK